MNLIFLALSFILGTAVGSFVNAWTYRIRAGRPIFADRSICPHCQEKISNRDLIPVLSYFQLGGRCRHCGKSISIQEPLTEVVSGVLYAATFYQYFGLASLDLGIVNLFSFAGQLIFIAVLLVILLYDLKHMEIPDQVVRPAILAAIFVDVAKISLGVSQFQVMTKKLPFGAQLLSDPNFVVGHFWEIASPLAYGALAGLILAALFYAIVYFSRERAMGGGDIKLAILLGLVLPWPFMIIAVYLGFGLGAIVGLGLVVSGQKKMQGLIPLAPFLVTGTLAAFFFGDTLFRWLLSLKLFS